MDPIAIVILGFALAHVQTYCARWAADVALGIRVANQGRDVLRMVLAC